MTRKKTKAMLEYDRKLIEANEKNMPLAKKVLANPDRVAELLEAVLCSCQPWSEDSMSLNKGVVNEINGFCKGVKRKKLFVIRYEHKYGVDVWLVRAEKMPTEKQIVKKFNLNFEPETEEEYLYCEEAGPVEDM